MGDINEFTYGKVGNPTVGTLGTGARTPLRLGGQGEMITGEYHGKYYEAAKAGRMFYACNPAVQVFSVGLTTTYTGLVVSNPAGSGVDLVFKQASYAHGAASASVSSVFLIGGHTAAGVVTHTSALAAGARSCKLDGLGGSALVDEEATIVSPLYIMPLMGQFTSAGIAVSGTPPTIVDIDGALIAPPGGWVAIVGDLVVTGWAGFTWEEVPNS